MKAQTVVRNPFRLCIEGVDDYLGFRANKPFNHCGPQIRKSGFHVGRSARMAWLHCHRYESGEPLRRYSSYVLKTVPLERRTTEPKVRTFPRKRLRGPRRSLRLDAAPLEPQILQTVLGNGAGRCRSG